jgi:hypothetical protein
MDIKEIAPDKLKSDEYQQTLWFKGEQGDLFIIFEKKKICHFEVTFEERHLEGGHGKPLKYGLVDGQLDHENLDDVLSFKKSRIVKYLNDVPKDFVDQAISLVHNSPNLEKSIAEGMMKYLSSLGRDDTGFSVTEDFSSFRDIIPGRPDYKKIIWANRNKIILMTFFLLIGKLSYNMFWRGDLRDSCKKGSDVACANLGIANLVKGSKIPNALWIKTRAKKTEEEQAKCNAGDMDTCYKIYDSKIAKHKPAGSVVSLNELACLRHNHARGCYYLGKDNLYDDKREKGVENLEVACKQNYRDSCEILNTEKLFNKNIQKCKNKDYQACFEVGMQYRKFAKEKRANENLNLACDNKIVKACMVMGTFHAEKYEVKLAEEKYRIACNLDHFKGCYHFKYLSVVTRAEKKSLQLIYDRCLNHDEAACIELKKLPNN